jgi:hypothetical protein
MAIVVYSGHVSWCRFVRNHPLCGLIMQAVYNSYKLPIMQVLDPCLIFSCIIVGPCLLQTERRKPSVHVTTCKLYRK